MNRLKRIFGRSGHATRFDLLKACLYTTTLSLGTSLFYVWPTPRVLVAALVVIALAIAIIVGPVYNAIRDGR